MGSLAFAFVGLVPMVDLVTETMVRLICFWAGRLTLPPQPKHRKELTVC